jgi:hypothetical protein
MKACKGCKIEKSLDLFHKQPKTIDGHVNFCIACVSYKRKIFRQNNKDLLSEREKKRAKNPDRIAKHKEYLKKYLLTDKGKIARDKSLRNYNERYPLKKAAHILTSRAIRHGKLINPKICSVCNSTNLIQAHHDDYTKPIDVRWLCLSCHFEWHKKNKPIYGDEQTK